jgi:hypothetical protein
MAISNYYYDKQLMRYIVQFMEIFKGLSVRTGKRGDGEIREMPVPVTYGSRDRVTAALLADNTQNSNIRLPTMAANMSAVNLAPSSRKGIGIVRRETFLPRGALLPDGAEVARQLMPIPYDATLDLSIYTSNLDQHYQVLEQILMFFDPTLQIQITDDVFDWTKISEVELTGINFDENYPMGTERRVIVSTLSFKIPIYIAAPTELKKEFVKDIFARLTIDGGSTEDFIQSIFEASDDEYINIASGSGITAGVEES